MEKKLSKTEKIKRLRAVKNKLSYAEEFMCCIYDRLYKSDTLFKDIPELWKFRPKTKGSSSDHAWIFYKKGLFIEDDVPLKKQAINKAIKLIQSK